MFHADLHIHSRFSRACSKNCDIEQLAWWALRKGISVLGTGDFTHPAWAAELRESLIPAEPGLLALRPDLARRLRATSPRSCAGDVRFLLSAEISTIYRDGERTRKVHHLIYAPAFESAGRITAALGRVGKLASDGRPILGLSSRDLLDITLAGGPGCYLVPAHAWTPWFAVLGSKSGYDAVADCYGDLAGEIFAVETGLSSDPAMNWRFSGLDGYRLLSNSDAHSPPMVGREATALDCELDYFAIERAFRTGTGLAGTVEFFPEGGKYHLDGHRRCGVRLEPGATRDRDGACPECGKPVTIGVAHRVAELADRPAGFRPPGVPGFTSLVPLRQVVAEIAGTGPGGKKVAAEVSRLIGALGPELGILREVPLPDVARAGGERLAEALARLRRGAVDRQAGYDGEYGTVRLFQPGELTAGSTLFDLPAAAPPQRRAPDAPAPGPQRPVPPPARPAPPAAARPAAHPGDGLDPEQAGAVAAAGPLLIVAGPGTGKTRTLTRRIAARVRAGVPAGQCLAVTFTRRAAREMRERLAALDPGCSAGLAGVTVTTFHGLGLRILREWPEQAGLPPGFTVADEAQVAEVTAELTASPAAAGPVPFSHDNQDERGRLAAALAARGLVGFDGLIERPVALLRACPDLAARLRERWPLISVDEYQDIDARQYELLRLLAGDGSGLTVIGDPDQAIYGFRGADVGFFLRFAADFPAAATRQLRRSYRSAPPIVAAALAAIAPVSLVPGRELHAAGELNGAGGPAVPVLAHEAADEHAEAGWISATIDQLLGGTSFHSLDSGRAGPDGEAGLSLAGIAVLYRTDAQAAVIAQALTRSGLPFRKGSHDLLLRRPAVGEILAELTLVQLTWVPAAGPPVSDLVAAAVTRLAGRPSRYQPVDIRDAGELLAPLARRCGTDLERFRTEVTLGAAVDALDPRADAVTLLTMHAAKGLEFDVVFVAGCERGLLPLRTPGGGRLPGTDDAEERRLLFVALTRARRRLLISYAARRARLREGELAGASPFMKELAGHVTAAAGGTAGAAAGVPAPRRPPQRQLRLL